MDERRRQRFLSIVVRSEPGGIEVDWDTDLRGADLSAAFTWVERVAARGPRSIAESPEHPLPERHPDHDELFIPSLVKPAEVRFFAIEVRDVADTEMETPIEPSALERSLGAIVPPGPRRHVGPRFVPHKSSFGTNTDMVQALGPPVAYGDLVEAMRAEYRRRRDH
jgi:hypothetical protein